MGYGAKPEAGVGERKKFFVFKGKVAAMEQAVPLLCVSPKEIKNLKSVSWI